MKKKDEIVYLIDRTNKLAVLKDKIDCIKNDAVTAVGRAVAGAFVGEVSHIVLCPWTLKYFDSDEVANRASFGLLGRIANAWIVSGRLLGIYPKLTRMDSFSKPYAIIFHEVLQPVFFGFNKSGARKR
jgi:hypothetical protein